MFVQNLIFEGSQVLKKGKIRSHLLDAELILSNLMNISREKLITSDFLPISDYIRENFYYSIKRRYHREPIAYITEKKEFWSLDFLVNKHTLIPRPETESLVFEILKCFKNKKIHVLDIGTGSGCILLSLLAEMRAATGTGLDISSKAIDIAKKNAEKLGLLSRTSFIVTDINNFAFGKYDLIVSNPPYIPSSEINKLDEEILNYEPLFALNGGIDGLDLIRKVIYKSNIILKTNGKLAIEIGINQYKEVLAILKANCFSEIGRVLDFEGNVRCIISTKI